MKAIEFRSSSRRHLVCEQALLILQELQPSLQIQECPRRSRRPVFPTEKPRPSQEIERLHLAQLAEWRAIPWARSCLPRLNRFIRAEIFQRDSCCLLFGFFLRGVLAGGHIQRFLGPLLKDTNLHSEQFPMFRAGFAYD